ncbi:flippase [Comamonas sp. Y33R10-2]|uniref:flippase n=1 Tax=Comamonas sp. Y33R10-2 TaxID=2853257 RepID=UPI001C5C87EF|nr:flippase [Comamonas sp. Y33R10-2]QXZ09309.1 flippase [Comamonas sp. Y33R10-2]
MKNFYKNISINLFGTVIPFLIAIPAMGLVARIIGVEAFGLFTLALAISGTSSILDMGTTKALVREVAIYEEDDAHVRKIFYTSFFVVIIISLFVVLLGFYFLGDFVVWLNVDEIKKSELKAAIILLFLSVPLTVLSLLCLGYYEGVQDFLSLNKLKISNGLLISVMPLIAVFFYDNIFGAVLGILVARFISFFINIRTIFKRIGFEISLDSAIVKRLFRFGGWLTISNIISVLMQYADRFIISNLSGAKNISAYTAPAEIISRITIIPTTLVKVAFPSLVKEKEDEGIYAKTLSLLIIFGVVILIGGLFLGEWFLKIWLGSAFDSRSVLIFQILLGGVFFNILAQAPYLKIQSKGYSNITAYVHAFELIPYFFILFILIDKYSLLGVAIAWSIRMGADFLMLFSISKMKFLRGN